MECPKEGFGAQNGLNVDDVGAPTKENLSLHVPGVERRCVGQDFVGEKIIIETKHVEGRIGSVPAFEKIAIR